MRAFAVPSFGEPPSVLDLPIPTGDSEVSFACGLRESTRWTAISRDG